MTFFTRFSVLSLFTCAGCVGGLHFDPEGNPDAKTTADLTTSQIVWDMSAQSYDDAVRIYATPHNGGGGSPLPLGPADHLEASLGGAPSPMIRDGNHYVAAFPALTSDADATIHFSRAAGAFSSTVRLAAPFRVSGAPAQIKDGDVVSIVLSTSPPSGATTTLRFGAAPSGTASATCLDWPNDKTFAVDVAGDALTFDAKRVFERNPDHRLTPDCDAMVGVRFETKGTTDPGLAHGSTFVGLREHPFVARMVRVPGN